MQVLKPGFIYLLSNAANPDQEGQTLYFVENGDGFINEGTSATEVIKAVIEKLNYEHSLVPTENYTSAINSLEDALFSLTGGAVPGAPDETEASAPGEAEGPDIVNQPAP